MLTFLPTVELPCVVPPTRSCTGLGVMIEDAALHGPVAVHTFYVRNGR